MDRGYVLLLFQTGSRMPVLANLCEELLELLNDLWMLGGEVGFL